MFAQPVTPAYKHVCLLRQARGLSECHCQVNKAHARAAFESNHQTLCVCAVRIHVIYVSLPHLDRPDITVPADWALNTNMLTYLIIVLLRSSFTLQQSPILQLILHRLTVVSVCY